MNGMTRNASQCTRCGEVLMAFAFTSARRRSGAVGYASNCKPCVNDRLKEWRATRPQSYLTSVARQVRRRAESGYAAHAAARRRGAQLLATPAWADMNAIRCLYEEARRRGAQVDHIVPLQSEIVCGLHCEANLQLLTETENKVKSNKLWPDMP